MMSCDCIVSLQKQRLIETERERESLRLRERKRERVREPHDYNDILLCLYCTYFYDE